MTTRNWPDPTRVGFPMFPEHSTRHVLENKKRRSLKLVLWDHEQEHYCTEIGWVTPEQMNAMDWEYYGPVLTPTQINEMLAAERERCAVIADAKRDTVWDGKIGSLAKDKLRTGYAQAAITIGEAIRNLGAAP